ncbi:hypothetical protein GCM10020001_092680 [Nonomuraea salmonea]
MADAVDSHRRVGGGVAEPAGQRDEAGDPGTEYGVRDGLRLAAVDQQPGLGEHPRVRVEEPLHTGRPDLAIGAAERGRRRHDGADEVVQQRLQPVVVHGEAPLTLR